MPITTPAKKREMLLQQQREREQQESSNQLQQAQPVDGSDAQSAANPSNPSSTTPQHNTSDTATKVTPVNVTEDQNNSQQQQQQQNKMQPEPQPQPQPQQQQSNAPSPPSKVGHNISAKPFQPSWLQSGGSSGAGGNGEESSTKQELNVTAKEFTPSSLFTSGIPSGAAGGGGGGGADSTTSRSSRGPSVAGAGIGGFQQQQQQYNNQGGLQQQQQQQIMPTTNSSSSSSSGLPPQGPVAGHGHHQGPPGGGQGGGAGGAGGGMQPYGSSGSNNAGTTPPSGITPPQPAFINPAAAAGQQHPPQQQQQQQFPRQQQQMTMQHQHQHQHHHHHHSNMQQMQQARNVPLPQQLPQRQQQAMQQPGGGMQNQPHLMNQQQQPQTMMQQQQRAAMGPGAPVNPQHQQMMQQQQMNRHQHHHHHHHNHHHHHHHHAQQQQQQQQQTPQMQPQQPHNNNNMMMGENNNSSPPMSHPPRGPLQQPSPNMSMNTNSNHHNVAATMNSRHHSSSNSNSHSSSSIDVSSQQPQQQGSAIDRRAAIQQAMRVLESSDGTSGTDPNSHSGSHSHSHSRGGYNNQQQQQQQGGPGQCSHHHPQTDHPQTGVQHQQQQNGGDETIQQMQRQYEMQQRQQQQQMQQQEQMRHLDPQHLRQQQQGGQQQGGPHNNHVQMQPQRQNADHHQQQHQQIPTERAPQTAQQQQAMEAVAAAGGVGEDITDLWRPIVILLVGGRGCGKSTQSKILSETYNLQHICSGDIVRQGGQPLAELEKVVKAITTTHQQRGEVRAKLFAEKRREFMAACGPDASQQGERLTAAAHYVAKVAAFEQYPGPNGLILDRFIANAEADPFYLLQLLHKHGLQIDLTVNLVLETGTGVQRADERDKTDLENLQRHTNAHGAAGTGTSTMSSPTNADGGVGSPQSGAQSPTASASPTAALPPVLPKPRKEQRRLMEQAAVAVTCANVFSSYGGLQVVDAETQSIDSIAADIDGYVQELIGTLKRDPKAAKRSLAAVPELCDGVTMLDDHNLFIKLRDALQKTLNTPPNKYGNFPGSLMSGLVDKQSLASIKRFLPDYHYSWKADGLRVLLVRYNNGDWYVFANKFSFCYRVDESWLPEAWLAWEKKVVNIGDDDAADGGNNGGTTEGEGNKMGKDETEKAETEKGEAEAEELKMTHCFDCEFIEELPKLYLFDILYSGPDSMRGAGTVFIVRYHLLKKYTIDNNLVDPHDSNCLIALKEFKLNLRSLVEAEKPPFETDGIILQHKGVYKVPQDPRIYKWKPREQCSVDFRLARGIEQEELNRWVFTPLTLRFSREGADEVPFPRAIVNIPTSVVDEHNLTDGVVVECVKTDEQVKMKIQRSAEEAQEEGGHETEEVSYDLWSFIRARHDKTYPNAENIAEYISRMEHITLDELVTTACGRMKPAGYGSGGRGGGGAPRGRGRGGVDDSWESLAQQKKSGGGQHEHHHHHHSNHHHHHHQHRPPPPGYRGRGGGGGFQRE